jgi:hypothetical protein
MTCDASPVTAAQLPDYAGLVSPRTSGRDAAAVTVSIRAGDTGSGRSDQGGGPLRGGLTLASRQTADITDPAVPYDIALTVAAQDGWLACESVTIKKRSGGPAVTPMAVRSMTLSVYVQRIREELGKVLGGGMVMKEIARGEGYVSHGFAVLHGQWVALDFAQRRRSSQLTTELVAAFYREALASPDPGQNRRPTAAVAERLNASRGHVSRLLTQARREGQPGLGPSRAPRKKRDAT